MSERPGIRAIPGGRLTQRGAGHVLHWSIGRRRSPVLARLAIESLRHRQQTGRLPGLLKRNDFSAMLVVKKIRDRRHYLVRTADKIAVRDFVRERVGDESLTELYAAVDHPAQIDWPALPPSFAMKAAHASGWNEFVVRGIEPDIDVLRRRVSTWLQETYGTWKGEWWYGEMRPRVLFEQYLGRGVEIPKDYKIYVIHGQPALVQVDSNRFQEHRVDFLDTDWRRLDTRRLPVHSEVPPHASPPQRPSDLRRLLDVASALGEGTDFVRVDLYEVGGRVVFGEMTHCPDSAHARFTNLGVERWLGQLWKAKPNSYY